MLRRLPGRDDHAAHGSFIRRFVAALLAFALAQTTGSIARAAPSSPSGGEPSVPPTPEVQAAGPGRPHVHIETRGRTSVSLYEVHPEKSTGRARPKPVLEPICSAPCDRIVDGRRGQSFVLGGPGLSSSLPFTLSSPDASLTIHARPGRRALWIAGWVLTSLGAAAVLAGAATLTAADDDRRLRRAGAFTFLAGVPFVAGGVLMVAFGRTRFRFGGAAPSGRVRR